MTALIIANTQIRQDQNGRYCLNDLHQASGAEERHKPANWLRLDQTTELIDELRGRGQVSDLRLEGAHGGDPVEVIHGGFGRGTYAVKELVYSYAMWISARFHLHVIRAYDALVTVGAAAAEQLLPPPAAEADKHVGGSRIFQAALRVARAMGMSKPRAVAAASKLAARRAGVDWIEGLEAADLLDEQAGIVAGSATLFHVALQNGEIEGVPCVPALTADAYALFSAWCVRTGQRRSVLQRFVRELAGAGVTCARKRYLDNGIVKGPHGVLLLGELPPASTETEALGQSIAAFRTAIVPYLEGAQA